MCHFSSVIFGMLKSSPKSFITQKKILTHKSFPSLSSCRILFSPLYEQPLATLKFPGESPQLSHMLFILPFWKFYTIILDNMLLAFISEP